MKLGTIVLLLSMASVNVFASTGIKLNPKIGTDGHVNLGIQYAYDDSRSWIITFASDISNQALQALPQTVQWNLLNVKTNQFLQQWTSVSKDTLVAGSLSVSSVNPLFQLLPEMKSYILVFSDQSLQTLYYFDIGDLCNIYPEHVADLTNFSNKACEVSKDQLPDLGNKCDKQQQREGDWLRKGLITCKIANTQLAKAGCPAIDCQ